MVWGTSRNCGEFLILIWWLQRIRRSSLGRLSSLGKNLKHSGNLKRVINIIAFYFAGMYSQYSCIIVDDEPKARELMALLVENYLTDFEIKGLAHDVASAKRLLSEKKPEVIFLDIQLPNITGLKLAEELENEDFLIVFVTAYDKYALPAFDFNVVDYVLKPIDPKRLMIAGKRCRNLIDQKRESFRTEAYKLELFINGIYQLIDEDEIVAIQAERSYCIVHLNSGKKITQSISLIKISEKISSNNTFIRVHRSWLVNIKHLAAIQWTSSVITMDNNLEIPIGKSYKKELKTFNFYQ